ncbi:hypothetical protein KIPB_007951 [Kipferlia bialata]|uniref:Uncharacterized protein n=1 Tax=Kipferlia bialata TaxID=797122 RepID=A0A9K3CZB0_9EUKA|nr:hypothetical protein KIPB_006692 [Kipferlia bialata]GIQ86154.1 hypothetical protein KIPB_007951 [Kipferlia bialata]|eukprot:g6692.t1
MHLPGIVPTQQQDASEFLSALLSSVSEACKAHNLRDVVTEVFGGTSGKRFVGKGSCALRVLRGQRANRHVHHHPVSPQHSCAIPQEVLLRHGQAAGHKGQFNPRIPGSDGMFYELNDSTVRNVSAAHMQSSSYGDTKGTSAYILVYGRDELAEETAPVLCHLDPTMERLLASQVFQLLNYRLIQWLGERVMEIVQDVHRVRWNDDFHDSVVRQIGTHYTLPEGEDPFSRVCNDKGFLTGVRLGTNDIWGSVDRDPLTGAETLTLQVFVKLMCTAITAMEFHAVDLVLLSVATRLASRMLVTEDPTLSNTVEAEDVPSLWVGMVTAPSALARCMCSSLVMGGVHYMRQWEASEAVAPSSVEALASAVVSALPAAVARSHDNAWEFYWVCVRDISRIHGVADALVRHGLVWKLLDLIDTHKPRQLDSHEGVKGVESVEGERLISCTDTTSTSFDSGPIIKAIVKVLSQTTETLSIGAEESNPAAAHLTVTAAMLSSTNCLSALVQASGDIVTVVLSSRFDRGSMLPSQSLLTLHRIDAEGHFSAIAASDTTGGARALDIRGE